jgi:hypothetical protein
MWNPHGIVIGPDEHVYVTQYPGTKIPYSSIEEFDKEGNFISRWGTYPSGTNNENFMAGGYGMGFDSAGNMYVANSNNYRIMVFDQNHDFVRMWGWGVLTGANALEVCTSGCQNGRHGTGEGEFNYQPTGLVIDSDNNIYVSENFGARVQRFTSDGAYMSTFGSAGTSNGEFTEAYGVAINASGDIYVADASNGSVGRIQKFRPQDSPFNIDIQGAADLQYVSLSNANNTGSATTCGSGCVDGGGNTNITLASASSGGGSHPHRTFNTVYSQGSYTAGTSAVTTATSPNIPTITAATTTVPALIPANPKFTKDLYVGLTHPEVKLLQQYLNTHGYALASTGAGSPGNETNRFGALTRAALIKLQKANNITPAVGYFGRLTRTYVNAQQ